jgi:hypothetical protein
MKTVVNQHLAAALADRYTIEREIGQGWMATVRGFDPRPGHEIGQRLTTRTICC